MAFLVSWIEERAGAGVGPGASFMEAGLDSFDIVALVDALREFSGVSELSILDVFTYPTVAELVAFVADEESGTSFREGLLRWIAERTGRSDVTAEATFAELGLDSFDIVALADELRVLVDDDSVSLLTIIECPSVAALEERLGAKQAPAVASLALTARGAVPSEPSFAQETLLSWEAKREPSPTFTAGIRARIRGPLDLGLLRASLDSFAARQAALRLVARRGDRSFRECSPEDLPLKVLDFQGLGEEALERAYREIMAAPFLMDGAPLVSVWVLRRSPDDHSLVLCWHHLIHDATGGYMLFQQLFEHYRAGAGQRPPELPALPVSYADFVAWEREYYASGPGLAAIEAEREQLVGAVPLPFPRRVDGAPYTARSLGRMLRFSDEESAKFLAFCSDARATHFAATTVATAIMLHKRTGLDDIVLVAPVSARQAPEVAGLVGRFGSRVPIRVRFAGDPTVADLLQQVTSQNGRLMAPLPGRLVFDVDDVFEHPLATVIINAPNLEVNAVTYDDLAPGLTVEGEKMWQANVCPPHLALVIARLGDFVALKVVAQAALHEEEDVAKYLSGVRDLMGRLRAELHVSEL